MIPHDSERAPAVIEMGRTQYAPPLYAATFQQNDEEPEEARLPLSQYLWILKRYRWRILSFSAAAVISTLAVSFRLTPIYEATATIDVDRATPADVVGQDSSRTTFTDVEQFLATQMKLVESDSVLRPVDQRFELRKLEKQSSADGSDRGTAAPIKLKELKVTRPPSTYLLQVSYRSADPQLAADAANAISQSYLEHTYNIRLRSSASMADFMERQLAELKSKMEQSGKALAAFERDLNVINPEEKTNILASRLLQLNTDYVRREFLGDLRTLVFETTPLQRESGRFTGRIWVEEASAAIVRFNGTYLPTEPRKRSTQLYFHFDSWRSSPTPGVWVPTRVYIEEQTEQTSIGTRFKAQTRFWNYASAQASMIDELTQVLVEQTSQVTDHSAAQDFTPFESQRAWERQAEENVLARLEKSGLLAPPGPVDKILDTVVNNLIISGNLNVDAHCRVLLTTPLETFSIGHTIVISRGLIDVLPDEASLALALADELAHIALGHRTPTQFSFTNQTMLNDAELLSHLRLERSRQEMNEAGAKTIEIMRASPYQKSVSAGLFLKALVSRAAILPRLLRANVGNQVANTTSLHRLAEFMDAAPELEENKLEQIAALPLGSRIKLNPWNDQISLLPTKPVSLISTREKIPFEIAPIFEYLTLAPAAEAPH